MGLNLMGLTGALQYLLMHHAGYSDVMAWHGANESDWLFSHHNAGRDTYSLIGMHWTLGAISLGQKLLGLKQR